jgi:hypothetical protein
VVYFVMLKMNIKKDYNVTNDKVYLRKTRGNKE